MRLIFLQLVLLSIFTACNQEVIEEVAKAQEELAEQQEDQRTCLPGTTTYQDCSAFKPFSLQASIVHTCALDGISKMSSQCLVQACQDGFTNINNNCIQQACIPNMVSQQSCTNEMSGAAFAIREVSCSANGSDKTLGQCVIQDCLPTHFKQGNFCRPKVCNLAEERISCSHHIPNAATAYITKLCSENGQSVTSSPCMVETCQPGFIKNGNTCVAKICEPNSNIAQSCTHQIPNSVSATRTKSCNSIGNQISYSECNLVACRNGYNRLGNTCVPQVCSPNTNEVISCTGEIPNSKTAVKTQTCNPLGDGASFSNCSVTSCESGYRIGDSNNCVPQTCNPLFQRSEDCTGDIANAKIAEKVYQCSPDGSSESEIKSCAVKECNDGFSKVGNACLPSVCEPHKIFSRECSKPNANYAVKNYQCNATGTEEVEISDCTITSCNTGYFYNSTSKTCEINKCTPNEIRKVDCKSEISNSSAASISFQCESNGIQEKQITICVLEACSTGYYFDVNSNSCIEQICEPNKVSRSQNNCHDSSLLNVASSSQDFMCDETGTAESPLSCEIICQSGYELAADGTCVQSDNGGGQQPPLSSANVVGWVDYSQADVRYSILLGASDSTSKNLAFAQDGRNCKEWLEEDTGLPISKVGVSVKFKDTSFINFSHNNWSAIPHIAQDYNDDRFNEGRCVYQTILEEKPPGSSEFNESISLCDEFPYEKPYQEAYEWMKTRWEPQTVPAGQPERRIVSMRAVARCESSSGAAHSKGGLIAKKKLQIQLTSPIPRRSVMMDERFTKSVVASDLPVGNTGESAMAFYDRIGFSSHFSSNPNTQLFAKQSVSNLTFVSLNQGSGKNLTQWTNRNDELHVGTNFCLYENPNLASDHSDYNQNCYMLPCGNVQDGKRPVLKCHSYNSLSTNSTPTELHRFTYEMGFLDTTGSTNIGITLNSPEVLDNLSLTSRTGPENTTAKAWIESLGIEVTTLASFIERSDAQHSKRFHAGQARIEDMTLTNACPYEIINIGDGTQNNTRRLKECVTHSCNKLPSVNTSNETVRPVLTCSSLYSNNADSDLVDRVKNTYSLFLSRDLIQSLPEGAPITLPPNTRGTGGIEP